MSEPIVFGAHQAWRDGDILWVVHTGKVSTSDLAIVFKLFEDWHAAHGVRYLLIDMHKMEPLTTETRQWLVGQVKHVPVRAVLALGMSRPMRVITVLINRAMEMLWKRPATPMVSCRSEAEARAWLEEDRRRAAEERT